MFLVLSLIIDGILYIFNVYHYGGFICVLYFLSVLFLYELTKTGSFCCNGNICHFCISH